MAPVPGTPKTRVRSSARPSKRPLSDSAPPFKKRKYIPGGPGGGGRYVDEDGGETPVGGTGPGGYAYIGPRGRVGRMNAEKQGVPIPAPSPSYSRPRRDRPPAGPRSSSAAAVAAAVAQSDGYKPREERGWEEFHQSLDIDMELPIFSADQVDGISPPDSAPSTPNGSSTGQYAIDNGVSAQLEGIRAQQPPHDGGTPGLLLTPKKRGPGRPPRKNDSMLLGLGSPPRPRINPLPTINPKERLNLPKATMREVDPFKAYEESEGVKVNYVDRTMANIGYQESEVFAKPEKSFIRVPEGSIEEDLDLRTEGDGSGAVAVNRVEYDMDEQDDRWLEAANAQRREEGIEPIKPAIFEVTMTQIEKEWHALEKRVPKPNPKPPQTHRPRSSSAAAVNGEPAGQGEEQDTRCDVCDDGDCENTNAIVFCDGCDLAVHQECYGVPFIPEGQWLCRRCQLVGRGTPVSEQPGCIFCPNIEGAFKQTTAMKWAHLLCAMWIPEVSLANSTFQEPVQDVEKVPKTRWKLTCYICKQKMGACIQCGHKSCFEAFHVTCARKARLCLKMKSSQSSNPLDASVLRAYCDKHSPSDWRREHQTEAYLQETKYYYRKAFRHVRWGDSQAYALSIGSTHPVPPAEGLEDDEVPSNKRKRARPTNSWRLPSGAPVVPQAVYHNVENSLIKFNVRKRKEFVQEACRYWTLKREARRGAALLKRLQLQMDAFSSMEITRRNFVGMGAAGRPRLQRRIEFAERLEDDMEQIRVLCDQVKQREAEKLKDMMVLKSILDCIYFPINGLLEPIIDRAFAYDTKDEVFKVPLQEIQAKLNQRYYTSVQAFSDDMTNGMSSVIDFAKITDISDADQQLNDVSHKSLTAEQKEQKKLAKRIFKAVQPLFNDAFRKESDLAGRPFERAIPNLEALLDLKLRGRQAASTGGDEVQLTIEANPDSDGNMKNGSAEGATDTTKGEGALHLAPTPEDNSDDHHHTARDEAIDEAAIAAQLGQNLVHANGEPAHDRMDVDTEAANARVAPPTPPGSDQDLLGPIHYGGIPWFMQPFEPEGTTVYEEKWTGRERAMSEDLSELDEEELDALDPGEVLPTDGTVAGPIVSKTSQKGSARKRARRR
ncbi:hypothetical protein K458DRAFT_353959 [Lentithecium fluviatile CBS 122367]|uniref:PHD finger domain-containing protein n=1 Tax=Lentithecium fluviatile CBS 122367 TaxID=1168545 RepID=A0A6G1JNY9_9PLEO|nr:hypothetical protein K458DRAFT_353959 [Lentithecium fluviatile CBS 122367]